YLTRIESAVIDAAKRHSRFVAPSAYQQVKKMVEPVIGYGCKMGEGWLLTAEMCELIRTGAPNIVCAQPFACLPNHVVGKAVIKELRRRYDKTNIVAVDYDPGASEVNQLNRIKLMISVAKANMEEEKRSADQAQKSITQSVQDSLNETRRSEGGDGSALHATVFRTEDEVEYKKA
ncbi:MAG: CoA activase, partial [Eggerthellaceae bacterium]|nr:CoA activase [Eggerthellaceae bacterium]